MPFPPHEYTLKTFQLDQAGDSFKFERIQLGSVAGFARFGISGGYAGFRGAVSFTSYINVSQLSLGENISNGYFVHGYFGTMANYSLGRWADRGDGFVGFRFNNGAGFQYCWARVKMHGVPENAFILVDYAYGDPGEPVTAGQKHSRTRSAEQVPDQSSLGWLAAGAVGLVAWRKSRSRTARVET